MKRIIFLLLIFAANSNVFAQMTIISTSAKKKALPIDTVVFTVQYEAEIISNTKKPEDSDKETLRLLIGKNSSQFFSYTKFLKDSVLNADFAAGASQETINQHSEQYGRGTISYTIYKNYPKGKITFLDMIVLDKYIVEEPMPKIKWNITTDTMTVCGYVCQKATGHLFGRDYEAWYTPEIPRGDGPWKLNGLPGLILKAQDTEKEYTFTATGIEKAKDVTPMTFSQESFNKISRKDFNTLMKRYKSDVIGYIRANSPNVNVKITDQSGKELEHHAEPYNPIELE